MNTKEKPTPKLRHITSLPAGTVYQANGGFWVITSFNCSTVLGREGDILVTNVVTGETEFVSPLATVVPEYGRFMLMPE